MRYEIPLCDGTRNATEVSCRTYFLLSLHSPCIYLYSSVPVFKQARHPCSPSTPNPSKEPIADAPSELSLDLDQGPGNCVCSGVSIREIETDTVIRKNPNCVTGTRDVHADNKTVLKGRLTQPAPISRKRVKATLTQLLLPPYTRCIPCIASHAPYHQTEQQVLKEHL